MVVVKPQSLRFNMFADTNIFITRTHTHARASAHTDSMIKFLCFGSDWWKSSHETRARGLICCEEEVCLLPPGW